jgi:protein involved in ribonucleotide reduction
MQGALQGQLKSHEQLHILPCTPTVASDHRPGAEATQVNVKVSETCSAVAYNIDALQAQTQTFLANAALQQVGTGYSLFGQTHVTITKATAHLYKKPVVLSFTAQGTWVYAVGKAEQEQIKSSIAGKTKQAALHTLQSLPGIEQASLAWSDDTKLPKDSNAIHLVFIFRT